MFILQEHNLTKEELLNGLNNILNNFLYGFICSRLVTPEAWGEASRGVVLFKGRERRYKSSWVLSPNAFSIQRFAWGSRELREQPAESHGSREL